jgi:murein DD-endopeptidase MepM/ murein hydrolase activator NlpD
MKWFATFPSGMLVGVIGLYLWSGTGSADPVLVIASPATVLAPALPCVPVAATAAPEPRVIKTPAAYRLLIPVAGVPAIALKDSFDDARGSESRHEAIDILAPRGTQVFAVADGTIAKLFNSKPGGLTVYQFDTSERFSYYYAHLDGYAADVKEGMALKRGDLVGYVGTSGNADPKTPHLHFATFALGPEKQWWKGSPINPYPLLGGTARP